MSILFTILQKMRRTNPLEDAVKKGWELLPPQFSKQTEFQTTTEFLHACKDYVTNYHQSSLTNGEIQPWFNNSYGSVYAEDMVTHAHARKEFAKRLHEQLNIKYINYNQLLGAELQSVRDTLNMIWVKVPEKEGYDALLTELKKPLLEDREQRYDDFQRRAQIALDWLGPASSDNSTSTDKDIIRMRDSIGVYMPLATQICGELQIITTTIRALDTHKKEAKQIYESFSKPILPTN